MAYDDHIEPTPEGGFRVRIDDVSYLVASRGEAERLAAFLLDDEPMRDVRILQEEQPG